ncbi:MAG: DUF4105 domain-containing protein, partial [Myxococcaceae bacterium]|nr:DUF4105 domain-containing protein [Myxococcaceae bacterium]
SEDSIPGTFRLYQYLDRDVRVQELNLTPAQAQQVATALGTNVLPEHRLYLYHHYNDNCSTRPRDIIDRALDGQLVGFEASQPSKLSLRQHTRRYSMVNAPMSLVLDFLQNDELDGPITRKQVSFLPDELERDVQGLVVKRADGSEVPLVKRQWNAYTSRRARPPEVPPDFTPAILGVSAALVGLALALGHLGRDGQRAPRIAFGVLNVVLGLSWGTLGLFLFAMGLFTDHSVTHRNENLFFAGPLTFLLAPLGAMLAFGAARARRLLRLTWSLVAASSVLGVLVKALPPFNQDNWNVIALALPVNLGFGLVFWLDHRHQQRGRPGA